MDPDREKQRQTYQLCRLGFALLSVALVFASVSVLLDLALQFRVPLLDFVRLSWLKWMEIPITWGTLAGSYMLWGRWTDKGWSRRSGLLAVMCMVDVVLWLLDQGYELGPDRGGLERHAWLRVLIGQALGWAEFALLASLSGDFLAHLGVDHAPDAAKATRSLAATGASLWLFFVVLQTNWDQWPPAGIRFLSLETLLLSIGWRIIWAIALIQTTALSIAATGQSARVLAEMNQEDRADDLFDSPSESAAKLLPTQDENPWD
jgi:hypothetical protein